MNAEARTRNFRFALAAVFAGECAALPFTGHVFDVGAFLNTVDRAFFAHISPASWWAFGIVSLAVMCLSQVATLFGPAGFLLGVRLFTLKLPFVLADFTSTAILARAARRLGVSRWIALSYVFSPAVAYTSAFHGTFDALANVTVVGAIAALLSNQAIVCGVLLGIGGGTKYYPAFFLPAAAYFAWHTRGVKAGLQLLCAGGITLIATVAPIHLLNRFGGSAIVENTVGVNASVPVSPWSLYYLCTPQIPSSLRLMLAGFAALFPTIALIAIHRRVKITPDPLVIARFFAVTALGVVILNPGSTPQFYSWIAGPCILYAIISRSFINVAVSAVAGALAVALEIATEGFDTFVRLAFPLAAEIPFTPSGAQQMWLATALTIANLLLLCLFLSDGVEDRIPLSAGARAKIATCATLLCTLALIGAGIVQFREHARFPMLADFSNREKLDTLALSPMEKHAEGRNCVVSYNALRYDILQNPETLQFVDLRVFTGGEPPLQTRIGARTYSRGAWVRDPQWINDLSLMPHAAQYTLAVPAQILAGAHVVRIVSRPCTPDGGDILVAHLNIQAAITAHSAGRARGR